MSEVVRAEMVANVAEINVAVGEQVEAGAALVLLESMKMEIPVLCEFGGTVTEIHVAPGDVIQEGDVIAVLEDVAPQSAARPAHPAARPRRSSVHHNGV